VDTESPKFYFLNFIVANIYFVLHEALIPEI